ncbi:glycosyltransferase family 1 protein [Gordonia sp. NPDC003429]
MQSSPVRVASVPSSHVYVRHLSATSSPPGAVRLLDPEPEDGRKVAGGWWPPVMLDPVWIEHHHSDFDIFHIHFGFDAVEPETMSAVVERLRHYGKPLVYTLHDLRNPHHPEPGAHEQILDILVPAADEVLTLTPGAAAEAAQRWGRQVTVLPHPHVVPASRFTTWTKNERDEFVVGVHAKSIRANMDPEPVIATLLDAAVEYDDVVIQINVHAEIYDPDNHWHNPGFAATVERLSRHRRARLRVHQFFSDAQLWDYLSELSVSVLPYRFGTHSGWLEACHDLGTSVIAPNCGFYREQQDLDEFVFTETEFDPSSLIAALASAYSRKTPPASWADRSAQREWLSHRHDSLYRRCIDA